MTKRISSYRETVLSSGTKGLKGVSGAVHLRAIMHRHCLETNSNPTQHTPISIDF